MNILITAIASYAALCITVEIVFLYKSRGYKMIMPCFRQSPLFFIYGFTKDLFDPGAMIASIIAMGAGVDPITDEDLEEFFEEMR